MNFPSARFRPIPARAALLGLLLGACSSPPVPTQIDNLPMYGQPELPRPTMFKQADEAFIANAAASFGGDRKLASLSWTGEADRYLAEHNLDAAMRRYNQAWLLDGTNYEAYWGFGRVLIEQDKFDDAVRHLKKAVELCTEADQRPSVLADLGAAYGFKADALPPMRSRERDATFALANDAFSQSTAAEPHYADAWRRWAISLATEGKYQAAAEKARRAAELGAPVPETTRRLIESHASQ
jgi:tetratricopeptide (TPR) repeat protein